MVVSPSVVWSGLVGVALLWGTLWVKDAGVSLGAAPLFGHWDWRPGLGLVPAAALGGATVVAGPVLARRAPWRAVPALTGLCAVAWAVALASADGWDRLTEPLTSRHEYEPLAARVDDIGGFLSTYVDRLGDYPIHVQGHPPGPVALAWSLDQLGLSGAGWLAALVLAAWGGAVALAVGAQRRISGEGAARRAAPALAVLPAAIWAATSMDALFACLVAAGIALAVVAATSPAPAAAFAAGFVAGLALLFSYGTSAPLLIAAVVLLLPKFAPFSTLSVENGASFAPVLAAVGAIVPLALAAATGFWWPEGLLATSRAYWAGVASQRPAAYLLLVGNPAALALAVGPAVAAGLAAVTRTWRSAAALLPLVALAVVVLVDLSQMSRGEVERIWLPFVPWLALAAPGASRPWLGAQVAVALLLQSVLVSPW